MTKSTIQHSKSWLWLVLGLPLAAVIGCLVTMSIAVKFQDPVVGNDYYKRGKSIHLERAGYQEAKRKNLAFSVVIHPQELILKQVSGDYYSEDLHVNLYHPTLANKDIKQLVKRRKDGSYRVQLAFSLKSKRHVELQAADNTWRLKHTFNPLNKDFVIRSPK